jgi:hypothetical protein
VPRGGLGIKLGFVSDMAAVLFDLYVRPGRRRIARRAQQHREVMEVRYHRAKAQTTTDTTRFFFDSVGSVRRLNQSDPARIDGACGMYAASATLFGFSGLSFGVAARLLAVARGLVRDDNPRDQVIYQAMRFVHCHLSGDWRDEYRLDRALVEQGLRHGLFWEVCTYLGLGTDGLIRCGRFAEAQEQIEWLGRIAATYGSDFAKSNEDGYRALLLIEQRAPRCRAARRRPLLHEPDREALQPAGARMAGEAPASRRRRARRGRVARGSGAGARGLGRVPVYHRAPYVTARFAYDVESLARAVAAGERGQAAAARRRSARSRRAARRTAARVAAERPEVHGSRVAERGSWERSGARSTRGSAGVPRRPVSDAARARAPARGPGVGARGVAARGAARAFRRRGARASPCDLQRDRPAVGSPATGRRVPGRRDLTDAALTPAWSLERTPWPGARSGASPGRRDAAEDRLVGDERPERPRVHARRPRTASVGGATTTVVSAP